MIIDMHCHYVPEPVAEILRQRQSAPCVYTAEDGTEWRKMPAGNELPFGTAYTDMEDRVEWMDELGVDHQVLSMGLLFGVHALPAEEAIPIAGAFNDHLSELCRAQPNRFSGLALLPLADMPAAEDEYRRARHELGLLGCILPVNAFVDAKTAARMVPIFEIAAELGGHIFVHPGVRPAEFAAMAARAEAAKRRDNPIQRQALDVQGKLAHVMITLTNSGFLDPFPGVTVQVANLGGTLPMVIERMDRTVQSRQPDQPLPSANLRRVYVDCASIGARGIEMAVKVYGAERIVLGSDYPIFDMERALAAVAGADISAQAEEAILGENAVSVLAVPVPAAD